MANLNQEQQQAFIDLLRFMNDPIQKYYRISGGAGTGKSFFISKIVTDLLKHTGPQCSIQYCKVTATTNKAVAVLQSTMQHMRLDIETIYSFMNLRLQSDFSTGEEKIIPTQNWTIHNNTLIIVDEASMVSRKLFDYIDKGTTSNCKILFVGDKNQLAPVKESLSPVYARNIPESLLIHPVRNAEQPALIDLCNKAKETVLTGKFFQPESVPGVIDIIDSTFLQGLLERTYHTEDATKRVLCYTNQRVIEYNRFIRTLRGYNDSYEIGEIVTNNSNVTTDKKMRLYTDQNVKIINKGTITNNNNLVPGEIIQTQTLNVEDIDTFASYEVEAFVDPLERTEVLKYWQSRKKWDKYFKIRDTFPDLRSIAASTTHKSQGSTYDSVIVDLNDIGKCKNNEQTARMLYVAFSRPKSRIYIRGQLPDRYFK